MSFLDFLEMTPYEFNLYLQGYYAGELDNLDYQFQFAQISGQCQKIKSLKPQKKEYLPINQIRTIK